VPYQSTHNTGGAVMGADPSTSAVNKYLQSWDVPNVFAIGASAFPQNGGYNPDGDRGRADLPGAGSDQDEVFEEAWRAGVARRGVIGGQLGDEAR
jgi:hypothetical protein